MDEDTCFPISIHTVWNIMLRDICIYFYLEDPSVCCKVYKEKEQWPTFKKKNL